MSTNALDSSADTRAASGADNRADPVATAGGGEAEDPLALCCPSLVSEALSEDQAVRLAARFKALADPVRVRLVSMLACVEDGELCACDLPSLVDRTQPTISHHLKLLAEAGLVDREQRGKWAWFRLRPGALDELRHALGQPATGCDR